MSAPLGVLGRLLLSFIGISAFAVLAAVAAMYSFVGVQQALDEIAEQRVPTALTAQELSAGVKSVVAGAPALLAAGSAGEHLSLWNQLDNDVERVESAMELLREHGIETNALASLKAALDPLLSNLTDLNHLAGERIVLADRKTVLLDEYSRTYGETQAMLDAWITNVTNDVARLRAAESEELSLSIEQRSNAEAETMESVGIMASLLRAQQQVADFQRNLAAMALAENTKQLDILRLRAQWSIKVLNTLATKLESQPRDLILAEIDRFRRSLEGENSMPALRSREINLLAHADDLLRQNGSLSRALTDSVQSLVQSTTQSISKARSEARSVQDASSVTLLLIVFLSLASSVLIVWLYVGRNLIARVKALRNSMLAIADGNLDAPLPSGGDDEIGQMAKALSVFRDTAVEVRKSNLREINEARQRLTAAIESISEGFSLYDFDDRLVVCNSRYRELLYPGFEDAVTPGASFESIIRTAAERGLVSDATGRTEEWVAERLARHRNPGEPHLQQRDQRWILISERKTGDGGTVAVYADITELKRREEELAEKSTALEQLSNQLAKYLSPQVYDSIFSGRQEVKVASSRKKLTIFFSDIAGFTEAADRLESEELTQLLNHYLTEMSQIALSYGATIDKYVGDAMLIFFGDPESKGIKQDALTCVQMAIAMRSRLMELEDLWRESGIEKPLRVRIGIHTGYCTVGNFGSEDRMDYTIIGGAVNTASRLQSIAEPGDILISYETFAHIKDRVVCEEHGRIEVKGIAYPVATYRVIDTYEKLGERTRHFREDHPNVKIDLDLDAMTSEDRSQAVTMLQQALQLVSEKSDPSQPKTDNAVEPSPKPVSQSKG